jgi:hypothetical protein
VLSTSVCLWASDHGEGTVVFHWETSSQQEVNGADNKTNLKQWSKKMTHS